MPVEKFANQIKDESVPTNQKSSTTLSWEFYLYENPGLAILDLSMTIEKLFFEDFLGSAVNTYLIGRLHSYLYFPV